VLAPFLIVCVQPLWAVEEKSDGSKVVDRVKEEMNQISDNVSESIARDKKNLKKKFDELGKPREQEPATQESEQKPDGPNVVDRVKKGMNRITDNISESIERDKKTLKNRFDKQRDDQ
jgi:flagellar biosynthesis/type III secretory pathway chaperone